MKFQYMQKVKVKNTGETGFVLSVNTGVNNVLGYENGTRSYLDEELEPAKLTIRELAQIMGAKAFAKDLMGNYYIYIKIPEKEEYFFIANNSNMQYVNNLIIDCSEIENVHWQESLRVL